MQCILLVSAYTQKAVAVDPLPSQASSPSAYYPFLIRCLYTGSRMPMARFLHISIDSLLAGQQ